MMIRNDITTTNTTNTTTYQTFPLHNTLLTTQTTATTANPLYPAGRKGFQDLPPELIHEILSFYTNNFPGLLRFSSINRSCKDISDHSLIWNTCDLSFSLSRRFQSIIPPLSLNNPMIYTNFILTLDPLPIKYVIPTTPVIRILRPSDVTAPDIVITAHERAHQTRQRFVHLLLNYHQKSQDYLYYYEICERIDQFCQWNNNHFIYFVGVSVVWMFVSMYFLYSIKLNHLTVINHFGFCGILYTILIYWIRFIDLSIYPLVHHVLNSVYLNHLFENFEWKKNSGAVINLLLLFGMLLSTILVYIRCSNMELISHWWITTIPLWISCTFSTIALCYRNKKFCEETLASVHEVVITLYFIAILLIVPLLFALYYDDPSTHCRITNCGYILVALFPLFLLLILTTVAVALYYLQAIFLVGCIHCEYLTTIRRHRRLNNVGAVALLLFAILLTIIANFALIGFCISCFMIDNDQWDRNILFNYHFTPLVYALFTLASGTSLLLVTFLIQDYTIVFR